MGGFRMWVVGIRPVGLGQPGDRRGVCRESLQSGRRHELHAARAILPGGCGKERERADLGGAAFPARSDATLAEGVS